MLMVENYRFSYLIMIILTILLFAGTFSRLLLVRCVITWKIYLLVCEYGYVHCMNLICFLGQFHQIFYNFFWFYKTTCNFCIVHYYLLNSYLLTSNVDKVVIRFKFYVVEFIARCGRISTN